MLFVLYLFIITLFIIYDLIPVTNNRNWKVFIVYTTFILFSFVLDVLFVFHINVPSPAVPIKKIIEFIFKLQG
ncbi:hypothetical protein WX45_03529 [Clostridium ljungdahlii DSM 13528]|uniref:Uncharacterized protein n=1 Tax=Clostridium ljungdahlii (strain ATCC 55383 / DSM 13528 / PETC) TaxID=748727 RepID=A0ABX2TUK1_CLOLD|nr:hypothetical protein WX45_03529 [Clostridium ljungdahlii DSM 13528]